MKHVVAALFFFALLAALCATIEHLVRRHWPEIRAAFRNERPPS